MWIEINKNCTSIVEWLRHCELEEILSGDLLGLYTVLNRFFTFLLKH